MAQRRKKSWADDEMRLDIVQEKINCATEEEAKNCLKLLEVYEHELFKRPKGKFKYLGFHKVVPGFQKVLHDRYSVKEGDQILCDFLMILAEHYPGHRTTIPHIKKHQFGFFLAKCGISLHPDVW